MLLRLCMHPCSMTHKPPDWHQLLSGHQNPRVCLLKQTVQVSCHQNVRQPDILSRQNPFRASFLNILACPPSQIRSARQAPSTIVTEQYLQARAASGPVYIQNVSATRTERISNLYADAPRFRNQLDILA